jgi:hypothetical protein
MVKKRTTEEMREYQRKRRAKIAADKLVPELIPDPVQAVTKPTIAATPQETKSWRRSAPVGSLLKKK